MSKLALNKLEILVSIKLKLMNLVDIIPIVIYSQTMYVYGDTYLNLASLKWLIIVLQQTIVRFNLLKSLIQLVKIQDCKHYLFLFNGDH